MIQAICFVLFLGPAPATNDFAKCKPLDQGTCRACKNCKYCSHCSQPGKKCSVCK